MRRDEIEVGGVYEGGTAMSRRTVKQIIGTGKDADVTFIDFGGRTPHWRMRLSSFARWAKRRIPDVG